MKNKVALITYHSAYNFGSILQALGTQVTIESVTGFECEIINYRMKEQKKVYSIYNKGGVRTKIKSLAKLTKNKAWHERQNNFEKFINDYLHITKEFNEPNEVYEIYNQYSCLVCGSDQIWNKHSDELQNNSWDYMYPYLGYQFEGKLISYASSIANMSDDELNYIKSMLERFNRISAREQSGVMRLSALLDRNIEHVLDPSLLLDSTDWVSLLGLEKNQDRYFVFYSLRRDDYFNRIKDQLQSICKKNNCKMKTIAPNVIIQNDSMYFEFCTNYGPIEFMNSIYNADFVITDSYHGTAFSINFMKPFISIINKGGSEMRKTELLTTLGLSDRMTDCDSVIDLYNKGVSIYDYSDKLNELRDTSRRYLDKSLRE